MCESIFKRVKENIPNRLCTQHSTMLSHRFALAVRLLEALSSDRYEPTNNT